MSSYQFQDKKNDIDVIFQAWAYPIRRLQVRGVIDHLRGVHWGLKILQQAVQR